jgi:hypothetical protein
LDPQLELSSSSCRFVRLVGGRAADGDVAERGAGAHLDRMLTGGRRSPGFQVIAEGAESGIEIEPRGDPLANPDFHTAARPFGNDRAAVGFVESAW